MTLGGTDAARRSTTPPRRHSAAVDDDLDAFAGPPRALSVLSEQGTVTERLHGWSYTTCLSRFCLTVPRRTLTVLVRPQIHSPRSKPSDQTNGVAVARPGSRRGAGARCATSLPAVRARRPKTRALGFLLKTLYSFAKTAREGAVNGCLESIPITDAAEEMSRNWGPPVLYAYHGRTAPQNESKQRVLIKITHKTSKFMEARVE